MRLWSPKVWCKGGATAWIELTGTDEEFSSVINLVDGGYEAAHVKVDVDFDDATPVANVEIAFYSSLDGSGFDTIPFSKVTLDNGIDPSDLSWDISGYAYFKIGYKQTAADTDNGVRTSYRNWKDVSS